MQASVNCGGQVLLEGAHTWLRVTLSVPVTPTTVVMPEFTNVLSCASGQREAGPASPPPPVM